ncbi:MAG: hypothetical protein GXP27_15755 [Planctomycetes bacterium]|nr:hypothetical protein [Planctomycetota bacterium]
MDDWWVTLGVGAALIVTGLVMITAHVRAWKRQRQDPALDDFDREHYRARYRRRLQTSGLIALLGLLIPLGDAPFLWRQGVRISTIFWLAILLLTVWIVLLAIGDIVATRTHARVALSRIRRKQRELESRADELKRRRSNGRQRPQE